MTLGNYAAAKDLFHRALIIIRSVGRKVGIGSDLVNLAWLAQTLGEYEPAVAYAEEGIAILRSVNQTEMTAEGLLWLGHARFGLGQMEAAGEAYEESLQIRRQLDQEPLALGVVAALSQLALAQGDLEAALAFAGQIVAFLQTGGSLDDNWEPLRIYWSCYQVLQAAGDPAAAGILRSAHQKLQRWAAMIPDEELRRSYLEEVPWHREIAAAFEDRSLDS
jgi:tetratricopeptide (TPR) repeat protein